MTERERVSTYEEAFPGRFVKAALFKGKTVTLTISDAYMETLEGEKGKEKKLILHFKETDKELVANKTNAYCLKEMFSNRLADWVGKRIAFLPTTTSFGPKTVDCIRVYGSPDIPADVKVSARIGRKQLNATLHATRDGGHGHRETQSIERGEVRDEALLSDRDGSASGSAAHDGETTSD